MEIREAYKEDLDQICDLSNEINEDHFQNMPQAFLKPVGDNRDAPYWLKSIEDPKSVIFVAIHDGVISGVVSGSLVDIKDVPFLVNKTICRIGTIVVKTSMRRKGIGSALLRKIENYAQEAEASSMLLEVMSFNASAREFYRSKSYGNFSLRLSKEFP